MNPHRFKCAFTIVELLLALTLTTLLTAALSTMIGQTARDRAALARQTTEPRWVTQGMDLLEQDLRHARCWAGNENRLVLLGLDQDGIPSRIEYQLEQSEKVDAILIRESVPLTTSTHTPPEQQLIALGLRRVRMGGYTLGEAEDASRLAPVSTSSDTPTNRSTIDGKEVSILIDGAPFALRSLPDQVEMIWTLSDQTVPPARRRVVLR